MLRMNFKKDFFPNEDDEIHSKFSWPVSIGLFFIILNFIFLLLETICNLKFKQDLLSFSKKKKEAELSWCFNMLLLNIILWKKIEKHD